MKKITIFSFVFLTVALMTGCGLGKMIARYPEVSVTLDNPDLENKGGEVAYTIKGTIPPKYLKKKATMTFTPEITAEESTASAQLATITLKGEKAAGNGKVINYKNGGTFTQNGTFKFKEDFVTADVVASASVQLGKKTHTFATDKNLGRGIANTSSRISIQPSLSEKGGNGCYLLYAPHNFTPEFFDRTGIIYFDHNQAEMNWHNPLNKKQAAKDSIRAFVDFIHQDNLIDHVTISGWASPEGEENNNRELSEKRFNKGQKWFNQQYDKFLRKYAAKHRMKLKDVSKPPVKFVNSAKGEDWDGFEAAIEKSGPSAGKQILNIINSQTSNDLREQKIRELTDIYPEIAEQILPPLRRVEMTIVCKKHEDYTDSELIDHVKSSPEKFSVNERLYAASLTADPADRDTIYQALVEDETARNDWRVFNNIGAIRLNAYYQDGTSRDLTDGRSNLDKAAALSPNNGIIINNLAIADFLSGDRQGAKAKFENAQNATLNPVNQDYALGMYAILRGDYAEAARQMNNKNCDYNTALVQLLNKDYAAAKTNLDCIQNPDAQTLYLKAVLAARMKDEKSLYSNLRSAIRMNASLKATAREDAEFKRYHHTEAFLNIVR